MRGIVSILTSFDDVTLESGSIINEVVVTYSLFFAAEFRFLSSQNSSGGLRDNPTAGWRGKHTLEMTHDLSSYLNCVFGSVASADSPES